MNATSNRRMELLADATIITMQMRKRAVTAGGNGRLGRSQQCDQTVLWRQL